MAKTTIEQRRLRRVGKAERCEALAKRHGLDADYAERGGDAAAAGEHRAKAERYAAIARQHRQEAAWMGQRQKARRFQSDPAHKARKALAAMPVAAGPVPNCLERERGAAAEIAAIRAEIARLERCLSRLPCVGEGGRQRTRLVARIAERKAWALEWEEEANACGVASPDSAGGGASPGPARRAAAE